MKKYIGIHVRATQTIAFLLENLEILSEIKSSHDQMMGKK